MIRSSKCEDVLTWAQGSDIAGAPLPKVEAEKLQLLREFTLDNAHFYCETADITRPFPSLHPVQVRRCLHVCCATWLCTGM